MSNTQKKILIWLILAALGALLVALFFHYINSYWLGAAGGITAVGWKAIQASQRNAHRDKKQAQAIEQHQQQQIARQKEQATQLVANTHNTQAAQIQRDRQTATVPQLLDALDKEADDATRL